MSNSSHFNNLGEQMKGALNEALATGDFKNLNSLVSDTVKTALSDAEAASKVWKEGQKKIQEVTRAAGQTYTDYRKEKLEQDKRDAETARQKAEIQQQKARQQAQLAEAQRYYERTGLLVKVENVGLLAGILFIIFGALANIPLFVLSIIGLSVGWGAATGVLLFFLVISVLFICLGISKVQLLSKAKRYVKLCGNKMYAEIEELATQVGISPKKVARELRKILRKGIIPSAHMDKKATHLMLNDVVYKQYLDAERSRLLQEKERKTEAAVVSETVEPEEKSELQQMISEGHDYIRKLRDMNDLIPGEVISAKLYRLEGLLKEIFQRVQEEPAQMNRMHRVMSYYLPTTLKLVESYHEFDKVSNPGVEITSAKKEIESTLDAINNAFVELLNNLFQDKVFDVTTDAQVLQTMLASEGLTKEMEMVTINRNGNGGE
uniref:5-bromo-4-chloroindolyl phosphate hydrolysis family protein n=1 Tax=Acetatifactor sp. TaxID=1872090 RepID=UPI00405737C2